MSDEVKSPDPVAGPEAGQPAGPRGKAGRGIRLALAVSVALNLAVAGLVVGMVWHGGPGGRGAMLRELGFGPFEGALRPEDREAMRGLLRSHLGDMRAARLRMAEDMAAILVALRAEPFAPEALSAAMARQADHLAESLGFGSAVLRDHLLSLDDRARHAFADRIEDRLRHGPGGAGPGPEDGAP